MTMGTGDISVPHLALVAGHPARLGGMEKFGRFVVRAALSAGWPVTIALSGEDIYSELAGSGRARLRVDRVDWLDATFAGDRRYQWPLILERRRWFSRTRPDVALFVQSSNTPLRASVVGAWLANVPVVSTHRTLPWPVENPPIGRHLFGLIPGLGLHRRQVIRKTWLTARLARCVVFNSQRVRQAYEREYGYPRDKGRVIPNAVEAVSAGLGEGEPSPATITIGFVGRVSREKRLDVLLRAVAALRTDRRVRIRIHGDGPERELLAALASDLSIADLIDWCGPADDVGPAYRACDLIVLCSPRESSSNMVLEAMAAGKPTIVTDVGGLPELVDHGRCGWCVPPTDIEALTSALTTLIADDRLRADLGVKARAKARREHDPASIAAAWLDVLREAAGLAICRGVRTLPASTLALGNLDGLAAR
ncbi:MAG: glycosyltransferase family 4 protein [Phycisphaerae bacterium]|nr:glycosyltransferase family 4 protein [Phycisphaerae bacterium]